MTAWLRPQALLFAAAFALPPAFAADAKPPAAVDQPVTTVRVGGSPADAAFRDATQKNAADYRTARTACSDGPRADRSGCLKSARAAYKEQRQAAKAAHDTARRAPR